MNIFLIGYRASGKSSVGRKIAQQMWKTFVDTDHETRNLFFDGATIAEVFRTHGAQPWREAEVTVTREVCQRDNQAIALGGGTLMQQCAFDAVTNAPDAKRIYLACAAMVTSQPELLRFRFDFLYRFQHFLTTSC